MMRIRRLSRRRSRWLGIGVLRPPQRAISTRPASSNSDHRRTGRRPMASVEEFKMAALAPESSPGSYTWTFPGCPIQIRVRLDVVDALQQLVERAQDSENAEPVSGGLLLGDTASPAVTEIAGIEPLGAHD